MTVVRRAILFTSAGRYVSLAINFILIAVLSRLLTPAEIGVSVVGAMIVAIIEMLRDIPTPYLVQQVNPDRDDIGTAFTTMLILTLVLGGALIVGAQPLSRWCGDQRLVPYCQLLAVSLLPGPVERPIMALMQRELAFERLAVINIVGTAANATVAIGLALGGFSYMSFAWAALAGNVAATMLALYFRPDCLAPRLVLTRWRRVVSVGGYSAAWGIASRLPDLTSTLLLGHLARMDAVGLYNRARTVNDLPGKLLLSGLQPVVFPALALEARTGRAMAQPYLGALMMVTALYLPGFLVLGILARPIVEILLGSQWLSTVQLVQIIALANFLSFQRCLTQPTLMAMGAFRDLLISAVVVLPVALVLATGGAMLGIHALAWSLVPVGPIAGYVELSFVRRHVRFGWVDYFKAIRKSAIVTVCTAVGPAAVVATAGGQSAVRVLMVAAPLAGIGWLTGLNLTAHPLNGALGLAAAAGSLKRLVRPESRSVTRTVVASKD